MTARFHFFSPSKSSCGCRIADRLTRFAGFLLGLVRLFYSSSIYGFQQLVVTEVSAGGLAFDVIAFEGASVRRPRAAS
jgi:hypothetical protein